MSTQRVPPPHPPEHGPSVPEDDRVPARPIASLLAGAVVIALVLGGWGVLRTIGSAAEVRPGRGFPEASVRAPLGNLPQTLFPELRGARAPAKQAVAEQRQSLGTAAWVDRDRGIARIPIDDAIDALAEDTP